MFNLYATRLKTAKVRKSTNHPLGDVQHPPKRAFHDVCKTHIFTSPSSGKHPMSTCQLGDHDTTSGSGNHDLSQRNFKLCSKSKGSTDDKPKKHIYCVCMYLCILYLNMYMLTVSHSASGSPMLRKPLSQFHRFFQCLDSGCHVLNMYMHRNIYIYTDRYTNKHR